MKSDVKKAKENADLVVVSWHWGLTRYANAFGMGIALDEAPFFVLNYQEDMGRAAIDAGADLVMGHHPHRLQGMEIYKGKLICYSLCNLAISFGEGHNFGEESVIVKAYIDEQSKKIKRLTFIPIKLPSEIMISIIPFRTSLSALSIAIHLIFLPSLSSASSIYDV
jgi:poly-gamma-glutamate synthesis protein (capsule biosynthesis protein)